MYDLSKLLIQLTLTVFRSFLFNNTTDRPVSNKVLMVSQISAEQQVPRFWKSRHYPGQFSSGIWDCVWSAKEDPQSDPRDFQHLHKGILLIHEYMNITIINILCLFGVFIASQMFYHRVYFTALLLQVLPKVMCLTWWLFDAYDYTTWLMIFFYLLWKFKNTILFCFSYNVYHVGAGKGMQAVGHTVDSR